MRSVNSCQMAVPKRASAQINIVGLSKWLGLLGLIVAFGLVASGTALAAPFVYIANAGDTGTGNVGSISIIDTATDAVVATVQSGLGLNPIVAAVHPSGRFVYVTNEASDSVSVIDTSTNTVVATVPVGDQPGGVAVHPAGSFVYVANQASGTVSVIDSQTNTVVATVPLGGRQPFGVVVHPDGTRLYVTDDSSNKNLWIIDTASNTLSQTLPLIGPPAPSRGDGLVGVAVHPNGTRLYVANHADDTVFVLDASNHAVIATVPTFKPYALAVHPTGAFLYVTNAGDEDPIGRGTTVSVIDPATNEVIGTVSVGVFPIGVAVHPDGSRAYVTNGTSDTVSVIDTSTNTAIRTVAVGRRPGLLNQFIGPRFVSVTIDIKPGSFPNSINPKSRVKIPVAILSSTSFNAVTQVDQGTLTFGRTGDEPSLAFCNTSPEDVNGDGLLDLVCHFHTPTANFQSGDTQGILKGQTVGGTPITGTDSVRIVP